jgi:death-on-curing protein
VTADYLALEDVLYIASRLGEPRLRDFGLVESAVARPQTTVFGEDAYPDLHTKAAALLHSLARNHAFIDGNKRVSWLSAGAFYWINGYLLDAPEDPAYDLVIAAATGSLDVPDIAATLRKWVRARGD